MDFFPPVAPVVAPTKFSPGSQLKYQKDNFQHGFILDKEESLKDLYAQKNQRYSYSMSAESTQDKPRHGGFRSGGLESKYLISQACTLSAKSLGRHKEGVDRAYPLQPISHHKSARDPLLSTGSSPHMQEAPNSRSSSISKEMVPAGRSQLSAVLCPWSQEPEPSAPHLYRRELAYILKLEEDRKNLEEAIQKKKVLLGEKLKRTEETLRRIQREKELIKVEERRASEVERTHEQKAARHPEEKTFRAADTPGVGIFSGAQSAEDTILKSGTAPHPQELAVGNLKEWLGATKYNKTNNSKIQDNIAMKHLGSCSKLVPKQSLSLSALSNQDSDDHPSAEMPHMQAASAVEEEGFGQCSFCKRKFLCARLEKHMSICGKNQDSKRKVFDSSKARARGTELEKYQQQKSSRSPQSKTPPRKNNWKQKHEALIHIMSQARQVDQILSKERKVSGLPPLPPIENPDYVACTYCGRKFAPRVAERHIPKCKNIRNRPPPPPQRRR
ncbi:zinc finger C2HC domain-containing protein 1C [Serinus canaria]|uniref:zinc finger C2HC domain-containing protein 1C n=1 Tax=Serinus canaria TaxID=9135 RepID=UPI0021CC53B0|nr:zinc finger C2HC domain-containing protein 1C [Serinus canaria]XP_050831552.1 zinc finger C2HC domain-containing protein 1C [Serinus canaria]